MKRNKYYVLSYSGGKDSTALLLEWLKRHKENPEEYPLHEVINMDLGKEFPITYKIINQMREMVEAEGIKFTICKPPHEWDELMFEVQKRPFKNKKYAHIKVKGRSWPTGKVRWCTGELKKDVTKTYFKELEESDVGDIVHLVAIAADEYARIGGKTNKDLGYVYPLADWGWTEKDCLQYCYDNGINWNGYYEKMDRLSCFCCPMKNYKELHVMWKEMPEVWAELKKMDERTWHSFKDGMSVAELEIRFQLEEDFLARGESINSRKFFRELRELVPWFNVDLPCGFKPQFLKEQDEELYNEFIEQLEETKAVRAEKARIAQENRDKRAGIKKKTEE